MEHVFLRTWAPSLSIVPGSSTYTSHFYTEEYFMVCTLHIVSIDLSFVINLDGFHFPDAVHGEAINMDV